MAAPNIVYRKTAAGLAEMQARRLRLPRKTFSLLLAVDGQRSREQLCSALSAFGDVAAQLEQLEEIGLIEDSDPRADGAFSFASPVTRQRGRPVAEAPTDGASARPDGGGGPTPPAASDGPPTVVPFGLADNCECDGDDAEDGDGPGPETVAGAEAAAADSDGFASDATTTWMVTGTETTGPPTESGPPTVTGPRTIGGTAPGAGRPAFVELDTWPGSRTDGSAPIWPRTPAEGPPSPVVASTPATSWPTANTPATNTPAASGPTAIAHPGVQVDPASARTAPARSPVSGAGPGGVPMASAGHPGRLPPVVASLQDARHPALVASPAGVAAVAILPPGGRGPMGATGVPGAGAGGSATPARPTAVAAATGRAESVGGAGAEGGAGSVGFVGLVGGAAAGAGSAGGTGSVDGTGLRSHEISAGVAPPGGPVVPAALPPLPVVAPLPEWQRPQQPVRVALPTEPSYPQPFDRSGTYPAEYNLIDIRAYIGVGSKRVDPLANVREAMAGVLARNIDLQNYELLHAIESMQVRDEFLALLPYFLGDIARRLSPDEFRDQVERLARFSGLAVDSMLATMVRRGDADAANASGATRGGQPDGARQGSQQGAQQAAQQGAATAAAVDGGTVGGSVAGAVAAAGAPGPASGQPVPGQDSPKSSGSPT